MQDQGRIVQEQRRTPRRPLRAACAITMTISLASFAPACAPDGGDLSRESAPPEAPQLAEASDELTTTQTPVALAIEIDNGVGAPLTVRAGQSFYLNQIDLRASITASVDEGVKGLACSGDFAALPWLGVAVRDTEPLSTPNDDGTITRRRFYQGATWMKMSSQLIVKQVDQIGLATAAPIFLDVGSDSMLSSLDSFFIRRLRAIQWTYDCPSATSCSGASHFEEEALVELRNATQQSPRFTIAPNTKAIEVRWTLNPLQRYLVPVTQVQSPDFAYGVSVDLATLTPPGPQGFYLPGQDITFQVTLRDGAGKRLHPPGSLPSYDDVTSHADKTGIQYYRAFFDPSATYWRRKHRERMLMAQIVGPTQKIQPIRSPVASSQFFAPIQTIGLPERDGVFSQFNTFPAADLLFGGAYDPTHAGWSTPASDTWSYHLPSNAEPGTYLVTLKGRRVYLGEDIPFSKTIEIQVGTNAPPVPAKLSTGPCNTCHSGGSSLDTILHANSNRAACAGCHAPLDFELEGPVYVRAHFLHSRSNRYPASLSKCSSCHLTAASVQRTSKSACLSCHTSYPTSHVSAFGPVTSAYVGGGLESFEPCTTKCHLSHPGSGL